MNSASPRVRRGVGGWLLGRRSAVALGGVLALAATVRFSTLGLQSYWSDEAHTAVVVSGSLDRLFHLVFDSEANPPLYYLIAWLWARGFGVGEVALRALSALCGTGLVLVMFLIARRVAGARAGIMAALLVACAPFLVWFSQEARAYSLLTVLIGLSVLSFVAVEQREDGRRAWVAWTVWSALALATHYFAAVFVAPMAVWLALTSRRRDRREHRALVVSFAGLGAVAGMLVALALRQPDPARHSILGGFVRRVAQLPKQVLVGYHSPGDRAFAILSAILMVAAVWWLLRSSAGRGRTTGLLVVLIGPFVIVTVLAAAGLDYLNSRNMIPVTVPLLALAGSGLAAGGRPGGLAATAITVIGLAVVVSIDTSASAQRDDWRGALRTLGAPTVSRAIVVTPGQGVAALSVYLPEARPLVEASVQVAEVDVVGMAMRGTGEAPVPPPVRSSPPAGGFRLVAVSRAALYTVERFRSSISTVISSAALVAARLSPTAPVLYRESPR